MRKYYPGITLFKFIGSILVVFTHAHIFDFIDEQKWNKGETISFFSIVVPCFYMISGFLAYKGWSNAKSSSRYIKKYLKWIILIYGIICLIYIVSSVLPVFFSNNISLHSIIDLSKRVFFKIFILGPFHSLWFIPPLIFGVTISYYLNSKKKILLGIIIAGLGFILAQFIFGSLRVVTETLIGGSFFNSNFMSINMLQLFITFYFGYGLIFVLAGVVIAKYEDIFMQSKVKMLVLFSVIITVCEYLVLNYVVKRNYPYQSFQLVFSMLPNSVLLFYGVLHIKMDRIKAYHYYINLFTIVIFFSHVFLIYINIYILKWQFENISEVQSILLVLLTILEGLLLTMFIIFLKKHIKGLSTRKLLSEA